MVLIKYLVIFLMGAVVLSLTKAASLVGLLDLQASTAAYLVTVIALGVEISYDLRLYHLHAFSRWLTKQEEVNRAIRKSASRAIDGAAQGRIKPLERD